LAGLPPEEQETVLFFCREISPKWGISMSLDRVVKFFKEVKVELGKVTWPNRQELIGSTIIVVVLSLIMAAYIGILDFILSSLFGRIIK
jgi:preprotein translocase subunit SecE